MMKIKELDGLRALAILLVLNFHFDVYIKYIPFYNLITNAGWFGVTLFFQLSGFLMSVPYIRSARQNMSCPSTKEFFIKRALRILPLYLFSFCVFIMVSNVIKHENIKFTEIIRHLFFLHNYQPNHSSINPPYWSLACEVQFYLIMPLLGHFLHFQLRDKNFRNIYLIFGILILLPLVYRTFVYDWYGLQYPSDYIFLIYSSTLANFDSFIYGIIGAIVYICTDENHYMEGIHINKPYVPVQGVTKQIDSSYKWMRIENYTTFATGIGLILYLMFYIRTSGWVLPKNLFSPGIFYSLLNIGFLMCTLSVLRLKQSFLNRLLSSRVLAWISLISYSMYIWHYDIHEYWSKKLIQIMSIPSEFNFNLCNLLTATCLTIAISILSYKFIEKPFLSQKSPQSKG